MSIDNCNILRNWFVAHDELAEELEKADETLSELAARAADGDEDAQALLAGVRAENAEQVEENLACLESLAAKGNRYALLSLGVLYHEGIAENGDIAAPTVILPIDINKSDSYLAKAQERGSLQALFVLGLHTWFRCVMFAKTEEEKRALGDEEDGEEIYPLPTAQDYYNGEAWLLKMIALDGDESLGEEERAYVHAKQALVIDWLSALYGSAYPTSPIHSPEKAREWTEKLAALKAERA